MQNSSINIYQMLLPGISNVTLRMRYYGLYAWLSRTYARKIGDTDLRSWQRFVRRAEALYALIAQRHGAEYGVAGVQWAQRKLFEGDSGPIGFADDAEPGSPTYYLKQAWGAYGAAYASQVFEVGIFATAEGHAIPVPSEQVGDPLAAAFEAALGPVAIPFFETVERGSTSGADLEAFRAITPSGIGSDSEERALYEKLLFAETDLQRGPDQNRSRSLLLILELAKRLMRMPSAWDIRWALYAGHDESNRPLGPWDTTLEQQRWRWWVYHANDLTHLSYETLLKFTLDVLEPHPAGIALPELIATCISAIAEAADEWPRTWAAFLQHISVPEHALLEADPHAEIVLAETIMRGARPDAVCMPETAWLALKLLAVVHRRARTADNHLRDELGHLDPVAFKSLLTEKRFLEAHGEEEFSCMLARLIEERVIRRHLWVALRKFRYQGDYTFLIETDDGKVRLRSKDGPVYTNPRLGPAITFLNDIHLVDENGLTVRGKHRIAAV
jgi:hypothetical protein